jgi:hypothetical protein
MPKFNYLGDRFTEKNFRSEFILACLQTGETGEVNWPREMKIMNKLVKGHSNDYKFWDHARTEFPIPSLAWFLTPNGKRYLSEKKKAFELNLTVKKSIEFDPNKEKEGEDYKEEKKKIFSLKEFLSKKS